MSLTTWQEPRRSSQSPVRGPRDVQWQHHSTVQYWQHWLRVASHCQRRKSSGADAPVWAWTCVWRNHTAKLTEKVLCCGSWIVAFRSSSLEPSFALSSINYIKYDSFLKDIFIMPNIKCNCTVNTITSRVRQHRYYFTWFHQTLSLAVISCLMNIFQHVWRPAIIVCRNCSVLHAIIAHEAAALNMPKQLRVVESRENKWANTDRSICLCRNFFTSEHVECRCMTCPATGA